MEDEEGGVWKVRGILKRPPQTPPKDGLQTLAITGSFLNSRGGKFDCKGTNEKYGRTNIN